MGRLPAIASNAYNIAAAVRDADLVIGAVLIPGAKAPKLVTNELVSSMRRGRCWWTSPSTRVVASRTPARPRTTTRPSGCTARCSTAWPTCPAPPPSSTFALTNATLPYVGALAEHGWRAALSADPALALGLTTHAGQLTNEPVGQAHKISAVTPASLLA